MFCQNTGAPSGPVSHDSSLFLQFTLVRFNFCCSEVIKKPAAEFEQTVWNLPPDQEQLVAGLQAVMWLCEKRKESRTVGEKVKRGEF